MVEFLRPQRLQHLSRVGPALDEEVAEPQQISSLPCVWLIAHHRFERFNCRSKIVLPVINQTNIQANARNFGREAFGCTKHFQGLMPLLVPHVDHAEVGIRPGNFGIQNKHLPKSALCLAQVAIAKRRFALRE